MTQNKVGKTSFEKICYMGFMPNVLASRAGEEAARKVSFGNFDIMNDADGRPISLGKGTFGRTYQARHRYLDTVVALKIITERYATDAGVRQRFLTEARAVAKLSHPHIARLYDFGEMDGVLHYAMEYCGGGSLADHVAKHGPLGLRHVVEVGQQIAGALKCAHNGGFIHRDLKPSNIMLTEAKGPLFTKLIDFGLVQPSLPGATRSFSDDQSADGARFLGTPLFASPEQLREEPMDVRTDLFSLGMTLWYLLLACPPENGSSAEIAASRLSSDSYASRLPGDLPPPFRDVLTRLLEKDRKNRFASAAEVFGAFNLCAAALGFRRARDYTDPTAELVDWEEAAVPEKDLAQSAVPEPIEVQTVDRRLDSEFRIFTRVNEDFTGLNYIAEPQDGPGPPVILHVLHPMLLEDSAAFERLRVHVAQLMALNLPEVIRIEGIRAFSDYVSILLEKPEGSDLMSVLRNQRVVQLIEAAPMLETIADACDRLCATGLPGVQLAPGRIFLEWPETAAPKETKGASQLSNARPKLYPRFLAVNEAPELARMNAPEDASSTMTTDMLGDPGRADNMCEHFGTLLYRIVAGRNCPIAASLSSQAYVAIPGLSEQANRLLSFVIAKQIESNSCGQILREIFNAEGIVPRVPGHPTAGFTSRPGSSTVSPLEGTPPAARKTPTRIATAPLTPPDKQATPARTWRPPSVSTPAPKPAVAKPAPPAVPVMPLPTPVEATLPSSSRTQMPPALPKEPVPAVSEAKVESKRAMEPAAPAVSEVKVESKRAIETPVPIPVSKPPAPEIVLKPVEARPKDAPAVPRQQERQKTVKEPEKPAAVVSPKVVKTREEKKAAAKPPVSPPPVEEPAFVTPKIMPAPKVPVTPPRSADAEEEPQFWDTRKLKPIGIGIAALLALSVSYVGVKALTKPSVKLRTEVAQPSQSAPPATTAASESAAPKIVTGPENAPPALTNPQNGSETAPTGAPQNQATETAGLSLTNRATAPNATQNVAPQNQDATGNAAAAQNVAPPNQDATGNAGATQNIAPPNQDATGNAGATQKQDAAEQSTSHTQPAQPQIAAKREQENPSNAGGRTRSGDASTRSASSGQTAAKSSGAGHSTSRSSAAAAGNAPPSAPARPAARAPAPPKAPSETRQRRHSEFEGSAPGG
jgi:serine/threonine protein kinase